MSRPFEGCLKTGSPEEYLVFGTLTELSWNHPGPPPSRSGQPHRFQLVEQKNVFCVSLVLELNMVALPGFGTKTSGVPLFWELEMVVVHCFGTHQCGCFPCFPLTPPTKADTHILSFPLTDRIGSRAQFVSSRDSTARKASSECSVSCVRPGRGFRRSFRM